MTETTINPSKMDPKINANLSGWDFFLWAPNDAKRPLGPGPNICIDPHCACRHTKCVLGGEPGF